MNIDKEEIARQIREGERGFTVGNMHQHLSEVETRGIYTNPAVKQLVRSFIEQRAAHIPNIAIAFDSETARQSIEASAAFDCMERVLYQLDQSCDTLATVGQTIPFPTESRISIIILDPNSGQPEDIAPLVYQSLGAKQTDQAKAKGRETAKGRLLSALLTPDKRFMDEALNYIVPTYEALRQVPGVEWTEFMDRRRWQSYFVASLNTQIEGLKIVYTFKDMQNPEMSLVVKRI